MELHCDIHAGEGPFLLLVHGILSSRAQWKPNLPALSRVTRPVVAELWGSTGEPALKGRERAFVRRGTLRAAHWRRSPISR